MPIASPNWRVTRDCGRPLKHALHVDAINSRSGAVGARDAMKSECSGQVLEEHACTEHSRYGLGYRAV
jgi:hypothetical protein